MAKKNENNLTDKQQKFADYYLANGCNAKQAYIKVYGTKKNQSAEANSSRLLKQCYVQEYIEKRQKELQEKTQVTQEWVIEHLKEVVNRCMQHQPVMQYNRLTNSVEQKTEINENGEEVGLYTFDSIGANKGLELLGKTLGMYKDKVDAGLDKPTGLLNCILKQLGGVENGEPNK